MKPNEKNVYDLTGLPTEQQVKIVNLIIAGVNEHIAYDHVICGTKL